MARRAQPPPPPSSSVPPELRRRLERCLLNECDIDPLILRLRFLRRWGSRQAARSLEQELLPLF
ncbi:MAG: hypothetical protein DBW85_10055 [Synechococcus sp. MED-G71]|nr:MAG: hypothetical protein DBW85_10055 [Synechococcus sp. MED-G71]